MRDINIIAMTGRLTRDPELKYTAGGTAILSFSLAVNYSKKQDDRWVEETSFFDCQYFGKAAESVKQYMPKGQMVAIEGELRQERWEKDGQKHDKIRINIQNLRIIDGGKAQVKQEAASLDDDISF